MNFVESEFAAFLLAVLALWLSAGRDPRIARHLLLVSSFVFYGFHQWQLVFLLGAYCLANWRIGLLIARSHRARRLLAAGVALNLVVLGFWKYTPFVVDSVAWLVTRDAPASYPALDAWYLPIGISFYSFTCIAYLADVYRGRAEAEPDLWRFALFISFFPQLVAGPILRAHEFLPQLRAEAPPRITGHALEAMNLIARGAFKKLVLADGIGFAIDPFFAHVGTPATEGAWSLPFLYLYALQIYFDFSAYTDIARGTGLLFGFRWPENFNLPYLAASVAEFWQRWHMTLSRFLRDYLYIPLGGSRGGRAATWRNLMVTMLLGGLWHGASWNFVLWGGLHGVYLIVHRLWRESALGRRTSALDGPAGLLWRCLCIVVTFNLVSLAWAAFRLTSIEAIVACLRQSFVFDPNLAFAGASADLSVWIPVAVYGALSLAAVRLARAIAARDTSLPPAIVWLWRGAAWGAVAGLLALTQLISRPGPEIPFIYFRF